MVASLQTFGLHRVGLFVWWLKEGRDNLSRTMFVENKQTLKHDLLTNVLPRRDESHSVR